MEGGVHVYVRKRPPIDGGVDVVRHREGALRLRDARRKDKKPRLVTHDLQYAEFWDETTTNAQAFASLRPLVSRFQLGLDGLILLTYGQTGSGKTYTLVGGPENPGLLQHAVEAWLELPRDAAGTSSVSPFQFQAAQIYRDKLFDLLSGNREVCFERFLHGGSSAHALHDAEDLTALMARAEANKRVGQTKLNAQSSRAHTVYVCSRARAGSDPQTLVCIDLAGTEKGRYTVARHREDARESIAINQSLFALKECIRAMQRPRAHVPFRRSKLTRFLCELFGCKFPVIFVANINPTAPYIADTLDTLKYAQAIGEHAVPPVAATARAGTPPLERYSDYILALHAHARKDQALFYACQKKKKRLDWRDVLRLLEAKIQFLTRSRRVFVDLAA